VQKAKRGATGAGATNPEVYQMLEDAYWRVLRAETSCNFFWGEAWVPRCHRDLDQAAACLARASDLG
jgi:hypothetical protein